MKTRIMNPNSLANLRPCSSTHQPKVYGKRGPSVLTPLKKFLQRNIKYEDPQTKEMVTGKIAEVIALRHILNATTGDHNAITDILDRVDGKQPDTEINLYTQIWNGTQKKASDVDANGRVNLRNKTEVPA